MSGFTISIRLVKSFGLAKHWVARKSAGRCCSVAGAVVVFIVSFLWCWFVVVVAVPGLKGRGDCYG